MTEEKKEPQDTSVWTLSGPKWSGCGSAVTSAAWGLGLQVEIQEDKGWFRSTWVCKVTGPKSKVEAFDQFVRSAINDWNNK